jgi:hypothetical protein
MNLITMKDIIICNYNAAPGQYLPLITTDTPSTLARISHNSTGQTVKVNILSYIIIPLHWRKQEVFKSGVTMHHI